MKWVVGHVAPSAFLASPEKAGSSGGWTTKHEEAWLFDTRREAEAKKKQFSGDFIERVTNEEDFLTGNRP